MLIVPVTKISLSGHGGLFLFVCSIVVHSVY